MHSHLVREAGPTCWTVGRGLKSSLVRAAWTSGTKKRDCPEILWALELFNSGCSLFWGCIWEFLEVYAVVLYNRVLEHPFSSFVLSPRGLTPILKSFEVLFFVFLVFVFAFSHYWSLFKVFFVSFHDFSHFQVIFDETFIKTSLNRLDFHQIFEI